MKKKLIIIGALVAVVAVALIGFNPLSGSGKRKIHD